MVIRKIDFGLQWLIVSLFVFCLVWYSIKNQYFNIYAFLLLPVLSIWQIISAILMQVFLKDALARKALAVYWKIVLPGAALFITSLFFSDKAIDDNEVLPLTLVIAGELGGIIASGFYLYIYQKHFLKKI